MRPPPTHTASITRGSGRSRETPAGARKMPDPIVMPTTSPTELQRPRVLGRRPVVADMSRRLWLRGDHVEAGGWRLEAGGWRLEVRGWGLKSSVCYNHNVVVIEEEKRN